MQVKFITIFNKKKGVVYIKDVFFFFFVLYTTIVFVFLLRLSRVTVDARRSRIQGRAEYRLSRQCRRSVALFGRQRRARRYVV